MGLSWYNGHSPEKRERVQRWLNHQWRLGLLERPVECSVCGQTAGAIHAHLEDYDRPRSYVDLCAVCHLMLHARFRHARAWAAYLERLLDGWRAPPLEQRDAWRTLERTILSGQWPAGTWHERREPGFLHGLSLVRVPRGK